MSLASEPATIGTSLFVLLGFSWRNNQPDADRLPEVHGPGSLPESVLVQSATDHPGHVLPVGCSGSLFTGRYQILNSPLESCRRGEHIYREQKRLWKINSTQGSQKGPKGLNGSISNHAI